MSLAFRNVDADPDGPVADWPTEAVLAALERGGLRHWRRLAAAARDDPWGPVARRIEDAVAVSHPYGVAELFDGVLRRARAAAEQRERATVAAEIGALLTASGLSRAAFARAIGTSPSRLSTYLTGSVTPSAAVLVRMRRMVEGLSSAGGTC